MHPIRISLCLDISRPSGSQAGVHFEYRVTDRSCWAPDAVNEVSNWLYTRVWWDDLVVLHISCHIRSPQRAPPSAAYWTVGAGREDGTLCFLVFSLAWSRRTPAHFMSSTSKSKATSRTAGTSELNPRTTKYEFLGPLGAFAISVGVPIVMYALYYGCSEETGGCPPSVIWTAVV